MRQDERADAALAKMGYTAELPRHLSMLSVLGLWVLFQSFCSGRCVRNRQPRAVRVR